MTLDKDTLNTLTDLMKISATKGNLPTAAVLLNENNEIVSKSQSLVKTYSDPTAHADVLCIRKYAVETDAPFTTENLTLVAVFEPSLMALAAASWFGIRRATYILPAHKFWDTVKWTTEGKALDKQDVIKNFDNKIELLHLTQYEDDFTELFNTTLPKTLRA